MSSKKYALVRWITGEDKNKMTVLRSSWIQNFNNWQPGEKESYVVEWRDKKVQPVGGWKCYDAIVINTSDFKSELEKDLVQVSQKKDSLLYRLPELGKLLDTDPENSDDDPSFEPEIKRQKIHDTQNKQGEISAKEVETSALKEQFNESQNKPGPEKRVKLQAFLETEFKNIHEKLDKIMRDVKTLQKKMGGSSSVDGGAQVIETASRSKNKVELYPGSGVLCDEVALMSASMAQTPGVFISTLLVNLFPEDVLLKSNFKGGANKNDKTQGKKEALDSKIMEALKLAAQKKFPDMTGGRFGSFVNNKLGNLRHKSKENQRTPEDHEM